MVSAAEPPGLCPVCRLQNPPAVTRCGGCGSTLPHPFDIDASGQVLPRASADTTGSTGTRRRIPPWAIFWTGAGFVWAAILIIGLLGFGTINDVAILLLVLAGPILISYSGRRAIMGSGPSSAR
jgi:hypothetical protein